jgi:hypothetical protein
MPDDRHRATVDCKRRLERLRDILDAIITQHDDEFIDPKQVFLELVIITHESEAAAHLVRRTW